MYSLGANPEEEKSLLRQISIFLLTLGSLRGCWIDIDRYILIVSYGTRFFYFLYFLSKNVGIGEKIKKESL